VGANWNELGRVVKDGRIYFPVDIVYGWYEMFAIKIQNLEICFNL
jgi:hypothetical protein